MARTSASTVLQASIRRWPIVLVAALVVGAAAFGYGLLTNEGPSQEAVSAVRIKTVTGVPVIATVDMGVAMAKSASTLQSAAESAGVEADAVGSVTAYVDPSDVQLVRIAVRADDPEAAEMIANEMATQVRTGLITLLEPDLTYNREVAEENEVRVEQLQSELDEIEGRLESEQLDEGEIWSLRQTAWGLRNQLWNYADRAQTTRYNYDRWEGAALVEGEAVAVEVDQTSDIIGLTVQGLLIGAIAGVAVAFVLGFSDARKQAAAA